MPATRLFDNIPCDHASHKLLTMFGLTFALLFSPLMCLKLNALLSTSKVPKEACSHMPPIGSNLRLGN